MVRALGMLIIGLLLVAFAACGETATPASQPTTVVEPAPQPTSPGPAVGTEPTALTVATVTGTVTYRERIALSPDAVVEVKLVDVSRADAPAITIGQQTIERPGQVPISFEIEYDPEDIDERFTYAVQARILDRGRLAFINDTTYQVITRGGSTHVDMALVMAGASPTEPVPAEPAMVEVPAPIDAVRINIAESFPPQYFVFVQSGLPNACHEFHRYDVTQDGDTINIAVTNLKPEAPTMCAEIYGTVESNITLGSAFEGGRTYTVQVNDVTETFVAQGGPVQPAAPFEPAMISAPATIERVGVNISESVPPEYSLTVLSMLNSTSCSKFEGYEVARSGSTISVTVTNLVVTPGQLVACTDDLGFVETEIALGSDFIAGESYTVHVNDVTETFVVQGGAAQPVAPVEPTMISAPAQIESVEVDISSSVPPEYSVTVLSTLNSTSCSKFEGYGVSRSGSTVSLTVTNLVVGPGQLVACTADIGYVETEIALGGDFMAGESYTVVVNGDVTESFVAK